MPRAIYAPVESNGSGFRIPPEDNASRAWSGGSHSLPGYVAATIATMPARTASGSFGHAAIRRRRSASAAGIRSQLSGSGAGVESSPL